MFTPFLPVLLIFDSTVLYNTMWENYVIERHHSPVNF